MGAPPPGTVATAPSLTGNVVEALTWIFCPRMLEMIGVMRPNSQVISTVTGAPSWVPLLMIGSGSVAGSLQPTIKRASFLTLVWYLAFSAGSPGVPHADACSAA